MNHERKLGKEVLGEVGGEGGGGVGNDRSKGVYPACLSDHLHVHFVRLFIFQLLVILY